LIILVFVYVIVVSIIIPHGVYVRNLVKERTWDPFCTKNKSLKGIILRVFPG